MKRDAAQQFGVYIKRLRQERKLSMRGLAHEAKIDSGALTRIEQGKVAAPQPETLKALAAVLQVSLTDMFIMAGYAMPYDLPSMTPYLRTRYGHLPEEALVAVNDYLQKVINEHELDHSRQSHSRTKPVDNIGQQFEEGESMTNFSITTEACHDRWHGQY